MRLSLPRPDLLLRAALGAVLVSLVGAGLAHAWLGFDLLEHAGALPSCPLRALSGVPCPGCGMTRALVRLAQLQLTESLALHPLAPLLLAAMIAGLLKPRLRIWAVAERRAALLLTLAVGVWLVRLGA